MAVQTTRDAIIGLKKGGTWGTEGDVTSSGIFLYASSITLNANWQEALSRDVGQGGKLSDVRRMALDCSGTITCDTTYGQAWLALLAGFAGTESSPAEQTPTQTDYLTTFDIADSNYGLYWTLGYSIESDRTVSLYSVKITGVTFNNFGVNQQGSVSFTFIADRAVEGSANTVSEIAALTKYTYEMATLGGTNHYFRIGSYSTTTALTNGDDKTITALSINLQRQMGPRFGLRGASTAYTMEPIDQTIRGTMTVTMTELDNSTYDMLTQWSTISALMAEFFVDGDQIGSGVNSSLKFQFPYLKVTGSFPTHHDIPNNSTLRTPSITYHLLKAPAAPSGMSGVTDLMRLTSINRTRSTKWTA